MRSLHESETIESSVACSVRVSTDHEPHRAALVPNPMGPSCPGRACQLLTVCDRLLLIAIRNRQRAAKQRRLRAVPPPRRSLRAVPPSAVRRCTRARTVGSILARHCLLWRAGISDAVLDGQGLHGLNRLRFCASVRARNPCTVLAPNGYRTRQSLIHSVDYVCTALVLIPVPSPRFREIQRLRSRRSI